MGRQLGPLAHGQRGRRQPDENPGDRSVSGDLRRRQAGVRLFVGAGIGLVSCQVGQIGALSGTLGGTVSADHA